MELKYKRMLLLPETDYLALKERANQLRHEIDWPKDTSTEREQKLYALSLAKHQLHDPDHHPAKPADEKANFEPQIAIFPSTFRARAQRLYNLLEKERPMALDWRGTGEVIFGLHGSPLEESHILDLILHATTLRRRQNFTPHGWDLFLNQLKNLNIPMSMLNENTQRELREGPAADLSSPPPRKRRRTIVVSTPRSTKKWINV